MPRMCAVSSCKNVYGKNSFGSDGLPLNFFSFPNVSDKERFSKFVTFCHRSDKTSSELAKLPICSDHFDPSEILGNRYLRPVLSRHAVPSKRSQDKTGVTVTKNLNCHSAATDASSSPCARGPLPSLDDVASSVKLPSDRWCTKLNGDTLMFFEVNMDNRPFIPRSVTFTETIQKPIIYIGNLQVKLPCYSVLSSISEVTGLLQSVAAMTPDISSSIGNIVASIETEISLRQATNDHVSETDNASEHNYASASDHGFHEVGGDSHVEREHRHVATLEFIRQQLQVMSASSNTTRRYEAAFLHWCLQIYFHSPAAYRAMQQSKYLILPSERLLKTYSSPTANNRKRTTGYGLDNSPLPKHRQISSS